MKVTHRWTLTAYCPRCGDPLAEIDGDTIPEALEDGVEARAEWVAHRHWEEFHPGELDTGTETR